MLAPAPSPPHPLIRLPQPLSLSCSQDPPVLPCPWPWLPEGACRAALRLVPELSCLHLLLLPNANSKATPKLTEQGTFLRKSKLQAEKS